MIAVARAFESEWLKTRHSLAGWLVLGGSLFTPLVVIVARLVQHERLVHINAANGFWLSLWQSSWQSMAIFFLPLFAILITSLITQIEHRNNAWKQVHALPLHPSAIFLSKLAVIVVLIVQFFVLFNVGIWLSAIVPTLLVAVAPYPHDSLPSARFLHDDTMYFIDCLPIVALQYLLGLRFRNFLVPLGVGFLMWIGALAALSWKYGYVIPYTYSMLEYLKHDPGKAIIPNVDIHAYALGYAVAFTVAGYVLFRSMKERG
ncbi:ABC transporter permease [Rhodanobacter sp. L36]|uniref:ABC transporter permease n=1 Tax=Rhodanobacter sp. L36 TaxID=1747221 RepID=UPI00131CE5D2|nr:ABC transporter permease [Rhodanobacter sp. L36]